MEKKELERRAYNFEIRAEKDEERGNYIVGKPVVYEKKTDIGGVFCEVIHKGALDKADLRDVRFLVNHDLSRIPLARSRRNNEKSTMWLKLEEDGLSIRVYLDTENNADARALYSAVKRGDITGMSFMFEVSEEKWEGLEKEYPTRHVYGISTVMEVSAVTFPAYEDTEISARDRWALENAKHALDNARQNKPDGLTNIGTGGDQLELLKAKNKILGGF
nr:MAG TPA: prohead serine protease [Caudoviricetes sp.]